MHQRTYGSLLLGLSLLVPACGSIVKQDPDAAPTDACQTCIDAPTTGVVKVTVVNRGAIVPNADVVFQNADDTVVAVAKSGPDGTAQATMRTGGSVTVVMPLIAPATSQTVYTFLAVEPGDQLATDRVTVTTTKVSRVFNLPTVVGATSYDVRTECGNALGNATPSVTIMVDTGCTMSNIYVTARGPTPRSFFAPNVTIPAGVLDLTNRTFTNSVQLAATLTNTPAVVTSAQSSAQLVVGKLEMTAPDGTALTYPLPLSPLTTGLLKVADIANADAFILTSIRRSSGASQLFFERTANAAFTFDVGQNQLPWLLAAPAVDLNANTILWTESNEGSAETTFASFRIARPAPGVNFTHEMISPHTVGKLVIPRLPAPLDTFNVTATDTPTSLNVQLATFPGGYDAIRATAFSASTVSERVPSRGRFGASVFN
ncbi:MAG TPA: hypothetical protein PLF40_07605 [Kofleriaceae bacterium]|nr:hypothetical protein [Kofleriaceae bacterium]